MRAGAGTLTGMVCIRVVCLAAALAAGACAGGGPAARPATGEPSVTTTRPAAELGRTPDPALDAPAPPTPPLTGGAAEAAQLASDASPIEEIPPTRTAAVGEAVIVGLDGAPWARLAVRETAWKRTIGAAHARRGWVYLAVQVSYEALGDPVYLNSIDWRVTVKGRTARAVYPDGGVGPRLRSGVLPPGRVAKGWIYFLVPARGRVVVGFVNEDGGPSQSLRVLVRAR